MGVDGNRLYVVSSGINLDDIKSIEVSKKIFDTCFMGDIIPRKGILDLILAWKRVTNHLKDAKLLIIGKGNKSYLRKLNSVIKKLELQKHIIFAGFVPENQKYKLLKSSKIFIFPSYAEGDPIVVREALACELPVVAYKLAGLVERYNDCILFSEIGDSNDMAKKTLTLLKDENLRHYMGLRGVERVSRYDWKRIARKELDIITECLGL